MTLTRSAPLLLLLAACTGGAPPGIRDCPDGWARQSSSDGAAALCLPAGFAPSGDTGWARSSNAFLNVRVFRLPGDSAAVRDWPPPVVQRGPCSADCLSVDSSVVYQDTLPSGPVATTTVALISGGIAGFHRRPVLSSAWIVADSIRALAQGWSANPAALDTLRRALRTISLRP